MFKDKGFWQIIQLGGITMYILLCCSIFSIAVIFERVIYYNKRSRVKREKFINNIKEFIIIGKIDQALQFSRSTDTPFASVATAGLMLYEHDEKTISEAMEREITIETIKLEKYTSIVGTIGSIAVYIGLFGTVIGIIKAFHDISMSGAGGINVVIGGISEALVNTAAGLSVAIPAVVCYNFFIRKIDNFVADMELCASELMDIMSGKKK